MTEQEGLPKEIQKVLVPIDLSHGLSDDALPLAFSLSREFNAHLYLLYVYQLPSFLDLLTSPHALLKGKEEVAAEVEQHARHEMDVLLAQFSQEDILLHGLLRQGTSWEEILKVVHELPADLIVMCTRGRRGLAHLMGSTAERVVRMATCPVVTVKPKRFHFVMP